MSSQRWSPGHTINLSGGNSLSLGRFIQVRERELVNCNWIWASCQLHRVTSGLKRQRERGGRGAKGGGGGWGGGGEGG